jgi:hypothetical protein
MTNNIYNTKKKIPLEIIGRNNAHILEIHGKLGNKK